jgi:Threonine synthase
MIVVQAAGCAPIVEAWNEGKNTVEMWKNASTVAAGLRVPKPYGDYLVLDILKRSGGTAVAVTDAEIRDSVRHWARHEGIFAAPEGAASLAAYCKLLKPAEGKLPFLSDKDKVVLFNTGTGLKYLDVLQDASSHQLARSAGSSGLSSAWSRHQKHSARANWRFPRRRHRSVATALLTA